MSTSTTKETGWAITRTDGMFLTALGYWTDLPVEARIYPSRARVESMELGAGEFIVPLTRTTTLAVEIGSPEETGQS